MLCNICLCREGLQGIWDLSKSRRVYRETDFAEEFEGDWRSSLAPPPHMLDSDDQHPTHYLFGHHLTLESYMNSVADGCFMCCQCEHRGAEVDQHAAMAKLGYYSLFTVGLQSHLPTICISTPKARFSQPLRMFDGSP
ncbi:hypothetical protein V2G26_006935 [Clonostachys chloroleuca]